MRTVDSDGLGRFSVLFAEGASTYFVTARRIGFRPVGQTVQRSTRNNIIEVVLVLRTSPYQLPPIISVSPLPGIQGRRQRVVIGGVDTDVMPNRDLLADPGDLSAAAALLPGMGSAGDSGYSVYGASPDQNGLTLNGMKFDGGALPPCAVRRASLATTTADPSRGQFSGGQTSLTSQKGEDRIGGSFQALLTPRVPGGGNVRDIISTPTTLTGYGCIGGPIRKGVSHAFLGISGTRTSAPRRSLFDLDSAQLAQFGLSSTSLDSFSTVLHGIGVPVATAGSGATDSRTSVTGLSVFDFPLGAKSTATFTLVASRIGGVVAAGPLSVSTAAGRHTATAVQAGLGVTSAVGGIINTLQLTASAGRSSTTPVIAAPLGSVTLETRLGDGPSGVAIVRFGGGRFNYSENSSRWEERDEAAFSFGPGNHEVHVGESVELSQITAVDRGNGLGEFEYPDTEALRLNRPSRSYYLSASGVRTGTRVLMSAWVGDYWRVSRRVSTQGGLRFDHAAFPSVIPLNTRLLEDFGIRTDRVGSGRAFSPASGSPGSFMTAMGMWTTCACPVTPTRYQWPTLMWLPRQASCGEMWVPASRFSEALERTRA